MRRASGSHCILRGTLLVLLLFYCASNQHCHATQWHPAWDKDIKLFYQKLMNRGLQSQVSKSRRTTTTGTDDLQSPSYKDRNKKMMDPSSSGEGMILGGHSTSTAFRLRRKKRGSFRLRKRQVGADRFIPLSFLDNYYALGNRGSNFNNDVVLGNGAISGGSPKTLINEGYGDQLIEEDKRGSFRLKKNYQDAREWSYPGTKRASFRLKRILDNYQHLLGTRSGLPNAFRLRKKGGMSSFRLKRSEINNNNIEEEDIDDYNH